MVGGKQKNIYKKYKQEFSGYFVSFSLTSFQNRENKKKKKKEIGAFVCFFPVMFSSNASIRCPHDLDVTSESSVWKLSYIVVK